MIVNKFHHFSHLLHMLIEIRVIEADRSLSRPVSKYPLENIVYVL